MEEAEDQRRYHVVVNDEDQYSIWPAGSQLPPGWQRTGVEGDRATCLAHVDEVWTDLRPRDLREWSAVRT
ncbi:MbtH protein [Micromonospora pisi]|uniref:MbtH protein n=1 Tax=Micromonospora pisi TaxID=589240 RepID=A0A495JG06_9ACTN|nr:MbtH family protein [Micromonospora pisi]RKR86999.1 MbtH protein [Micromonospora pisi]